MKKILTIAIIAISSSMYGQLKTVEFTNDVPASTDITIEVPDIKKHIVNRRVNGTWDPKSINYVQSTGLKVNATSNDGLPLLITGIHSDVEATASPEQQAVGYLEAAAELMQIANPQDEWQITKVTTDDLGMTHVRCQQVYEGVPVYGSEVIVHGTAQGMKTLNGRYKATPQNVKTAPTITGLQASSNVSADLGKKVVPTVDPFNLWDKQQDKVELVLYPLDKGLYLAYHYTTYKDIVSRWEYFVDAHTGNILHKYESICKFHNHDLGHACAHTEEAPVPPVISSSQNLEGNTVAINTWNSGSNFFMIDAVRSEMFDAANSSMPNEPAGTIWTIDAFDTSPENADFTYDHVSSSNQNFPNKRVAVTAHQNGGRAYEYFLNTHNRVSINGQGGNIISIVNVADEDGGGLDNAFWNGVAMFYGNGRSGFRELARGLDVAGHEMTHGVVQSTANLEYQGESGALNESMADVFGAMIDRDDWLIGEDVVLTSSFPSGALRSMSDPHNGATFGNYGGGFQPKKYSERFTGSENNGGVHINSGIPNHAYYLFATSANVGRARAEQVWYRALTTYLTKSSQFVDARVATVRAAQDLPFGTEVLPALRAAWDAVEVFGESGNTFEEEVDVNPGSDLIVFTSVGANGQNDLFVADAAGTLIYNPLTEMNPISTPSVTDDGSEILYVTDQGELGYVFINWETGEIERDITLNSNGGWRNAVFSKDGLRLAATRQIQEDSIFVFDFVSGSGSWFELFNPTFSQDGTTTGDVQFVDAMEFDFTGEFVMYDAFNSIESIFGNDIDYWDIGFIKVWNNAAETFTLDGQISKLFSGLPEGVSIGNPTFSKNSPFIIAFDELADNEFSIKGANIETGDVGTIFTGNDRPGYPSFSLDDDRLIFDFRNNGIEIVAGRDLADDKINGTGQATIQLGYDIGIQWGVWFGNGARMFTDVNETPLAGVTIYPNPTDGVLTIDLAAYANSSYDVEVVDMMGRTVLTNQNERTIDLNNAPAGQYVIRIKSEAGLHSQIVTKK